MKETKTENTAKEENALVEESDAESCESNAIVVEDAPVENENATVQPQDGVSVENRGSPAEDEGYDG